MTLETPTPASDEVAGAAAKVDDREADGKSLLTPPVYHVPPSVSTGNAQPYLRELARQAERLAIHHEQMALAAHAVWLTEVAAAGKHTAILAGLRLVIDDDEEEAHGED